MISLREKAGSLHLYSGKKYERAALAAALIKELDRIRILFPEAKEEYLKYYREKCKTTGKYVLARSAAEEKEAFALKINEDFSIRLRFADGSEKDMNSGELSLLPLKNC